MVEISAKLNNRSVYLLGELIECTIIFENLKQDSDCTSFESNTNICETIAWATAQIICYNQTNSTVLGSNSNRNQNFNSDLPVSSTSTALSLDQRSDISIEYVTNPCILLCDLQLLPGHKKSYIYRETLPLDTPPTYKGNAIKYFYKVVIATQRISSPIRKINIPFRVLPLEANLIQAAFYQNYSDEVTPTNPFLVEIEKITPTNVAFDEIQNITSRRNTSFYSISSDLGRVGRFCLFKSTYKLGEDIVGTFDFSSATVRCIQVLISLQSEENVFSTDEIFKKSVSKTHIASAGYEQCDLLLPIPYHITPNFTSSLMQLSWTLKFEFVITKLDNLDYNRGNEGKWQAPNELPIKTMIWSLPVRILSSSPIQIAQYE